MTQPYFPSVIDSSMLSDFKSCQQLAFLRHIQEYKPKAHSVHLLAGGSFAKGIEVTRRAFFEQSLSSEDSIQSGLAALLKAYGDFECPSDSAKSAERMAGAFEYYWSHYPLGEDGTEPLLMASGRRAIEFTFAHPLPILHPISGDPLIYSGSMDALLSFANGIYITDEKTTSSLGATWSRQWDLRAQFSAYAWGCRESGIKVDGALIRGISILKTKYDTQQAIVPRPEWQVDRWYNEMLEWVEDLVRAFKRASWRHNLDHACAEYGGCSYRQICLTQEPNSWLETYFERRHWDPILRKETIL